MSGQEGPNCSQRWLIRYEWFMGTVGSLISESLLPLGWRLVRCTVFQSGTGGQTVSLPVAGVLAIVTSTFCAGIYPDGLSSWDHLAAWCIDIAVWTIFTFRTAFARLVDRVDTWWRRTICNQTAGNAITVTGALLTFRRLEVLSQLVHHSSVLTADLLTPGAAVGGIVADMDACSRQRGALSAGTCRTLGGALTLSAMVRVQKIPFPNKVYAPVCLAGALLLSGDWESQTGLCVKEKCQNCCAYSALHHRDHLMSQPSSLLVISD